MSRHYQKTYKKVFWPILGLSFLISISLVASSISLAPQADETALNDSNPNPPVSGTAACRGNKLDIAYVIDNSGSMDDHGSDQILRSFVTKAQDKFRTGDDSLALITYKYTPEVKDKIVKKPFTTDIASITAAVKDLKFNADGSGSDQGMSFAGGHFNESRRFETDPVTGTRSALPGVIILIGENNGGNKTNVGPISHTLATNLFESLNIRTYTVSLGLTHNELAQVATKGGGKSYVVNTSSTPNVMPEPIVNSLFQDIARTFEGCVHVTLNTNKEVVRTGDTLSLTYTVVNATRNDLNDMKISQPIPAGLHLDEDQDGAYDSTVVLEVGKDEQVAGATAEYKKDVKLVE